MSRPAPRLHCGSATALVSILLAWTVTFLLVLACRSPSQLARLTVTATSRPSTPSATPSAESAPSPPATQAPSVALAVARVSPAVVLRELTYSVLNSPTKGELSGEGVNRTNNPNANVNRPDASPSKRMMVRAPRFGSLRHASGSSEGGTVPKRAGSGRLSAPQVPAMCRAVVLLECPSTVGCAVGEAAASFACVPTTRRGGSS